MADKHSEAVGDQTLRCTYTAGGQQTVLQLNITAARPAFADVTNGGHTIVYAGYLRRTLTYQLQDQFLRNLKEVYSYTDHTAQTVNVRVVDLLASEQLLVISKVPGSAPDPTPEENVAVSNSGGFIDTHGLPRNVQIEVKQWILVHIRSWTYNDRGFGNVVRVLRIKAGFDPDPEKIRIYEDPDGPEIPEEP